MSNVSMNSNSVNQSLEPKKAKDKGVAKKVIEKEEKIVKKQEDVKVELSDKAKELQKQLEDKI